MIKNNPKIICGFSDITALVNSIYAKIKNEGMKVLNSGTAKGKIIGGNLCTLNLLQGTEYMPELEDSILFIEDDGETGKYFNKEFDRNLQSLLHSAKGKKIRGLVIISQYFQLQN